LYDININVRLRVIVEGGEKQSLIHHEECDFRKIPLNPPFSKGETFSLLAVSTFKKAFPFFKEAFSLPAVSTFKKASPFEKGGLRGIL
jgi:hypothetical protein